MAKSAKEVIRDMLLPRLPEGSRCMPEVAKLLRELNQVASEFHRRITLPYWSIQTRTQQLAYVSHPNYLEAEQQVRGLMARLKEPHKVSLVGIGTIMDFCEAFIEAYRIKYPG